MKKKKKFEFSSLDKQTTNSFTFINIKIEFFSLSKCVFPSLPTYLIKFLTDLTLQIKNAF